MNINTKTTLTHSSSELIEKRKELDSITAPCPNQKKKTCLLNRDTSLQEWQQELSGLLQLPYEIFEKIALLLNHSSLLALDATHLHTHKFMETVWERLSKKKWLQFPWETTGQKTSFKVNYWINKRIQRYLLHDAPLTGNKSPEAAQPLIEVRYGKFMHRFPTIGALITKDLEESKGSDRLPHQIHFQSQQGASQGTGESLFQVYLNAKAYLHSVSKMTKSELKLNFASIKNHFNEAILKGNTLASLVAIRLFLHKLPTKNLLKWALKSAHQGDPRAFALLIAYRNTSNDDEFCIAYDRILNQDLATAKLAVRYGWKIYNVSEKFINDPEIIKLAIQKNAWYLEELDEEFQNDPEVVKLAVQIAGLTLAFTSEELQNDPEIVKLAVQQNGWALRCASKELQDDFEIVKLAVQQEGKSLQHASERLQNDPEIVKLAVQQDGLALQYASKELQNDPEIVKLAVQNNGLALEFMSKELQNNPVIVKLAVQQNGLALRYASKELQSDPEIVKLAVKQNGWALQYASEELRNNPEIVKIAIQQNGWALQFTSKELRNTPFFFTLAVQQIESKPESLSPDYFSYPSVYLFTAPEDFRNHATFVKLALQRNGLELEYVSKELQNNREIVKLAVQQNGLALKYASKELQNDSEIVTLAIEQNGLAFKFASEELRNTSMLIRQAIRKNPRICKPDWILGGRLKSYIPATLQEDPEFRDFVCFQVLWHWYKSKDDSLLEMLKEYGKNAVD
jgi:hypothetical protein